MPYRALMQFQVAGGRWVQAGEMVPEADEWPNPDPWVGTHLELVHEVDLDTSGKEVVVEEGGSEEAPPSSPPKKKTTARKKPTAKKATARKSTAKKKS